MVGSGDPWEDQRRHQRLTCRLEAELVFGGATWRCWIRDISPAGASLEPAIPAALGAQVELTCPRFGFASALAGRVVNVADDRTNMAFELDDAMQYNLAKFLAANLDLP